MIGVTEVIKRSLRRITPRSTSLDRMRHLIIGTILIALGLWGVSVWWASFGLVMRAMIPLALLVVGSLAVLSSYYRLNESEAATDPEVDSDDASDPAGEEDGEDDESDEDED
jgi:hypothetical protein